MYFFNFQLHPEVQPLTYFEQKKYLFRIPSTDKWYPFHIPCLDLYMHLSTAVNLLSIKYEQIAKPERFLDLFTAIECIC